MATLIHTLSDLVFGVAADGTITIKNAGTTISTIAAGTWRKWYTYYSGTDLYFVDMDSAAPGGGLTHKSLKNNSDLNVTSGTSGGRVSIIGKGDIRPDGVLTTIPVDVQNANSGSISKYAIVKCTGSTDPSPTFFLSYP